MRSWWYMVGETRKGPISESQLESLFQTDEVSDATLVWCEGLEGWQAIGTIDVAALPVLSPDIQPVRSEVQFQGLKGVIDIIDVEDVAVAVDNAAAATMQSYDEPVQPIVAVINAAENIPAEPVAVELEAVVVEAEPQPQLDLVRPLDNKPQMKTSSFQEAAQRGQAARLEEMAQKVPAKQDGVNLSAADQKRVKGSVEGRGLLYIALASLLALPLVWFGSSFLLGDKEEKGISWKNPETFADVDLAKPWSVTTSINAEQQIFYRFSHKKEPITVRFGKETFTEDTSLKDYSELFSLAIGGEIYLKPKSTEGTILNKKTLTFEGYKIKDQNQKVSVTFVKHGKQIWRTLVINKAGGRPKTKSYQILRANLIHSLD